MEQKEEGEKAAERQKLSLSSNSCRSIFSLCKNERVCAGPGSVPGSDRVCGPVSVPGCPAAQPDQRPAAGVSFDL